MMITFYLPLVVCAILFTKYQQSNRWIFGPISLLYFTYAGMCVAAVIGLIYEFELPILALSNNAMWYFSILLLLLLAGFYFLKDRDYNKIIIENYRLYNIIKYFLLISSVLSFIYFLPFAINGLQGDISANRDTQTNLEQMSRYGIINTFFSLVGNCFIFCQIAGLIELTSSTRKRTVLGYSLILSSLSYYVYILAFVGRDGFVYWTMSAIFSFLLVRHFLPKFERIRVILLFVIIEIIILIPFLEITNSRFGSGVHSELKISKPFELPQAKIDGQAAETQRPATQRPAHGQAAETQRPAHGQAAETQRPAHGNSNVVYILENIVDYAGQQIANFNDLYVVAPPPRRGGENFPKILQLLEQIGIDFNPIYDRSEIEEYYFSKGTVPWEFSTIIGSFFIDFGMIGTIIVVLFMSSMSLFLQRKVKEKQGFYLSELIIFVLLYQSVFWGVFYFRLYSANLYMLIVLIGSIFLIITRSKNSYQIILKVRE